jgi:DNA transformation protein and related proteins
VDADFIRDLFAEFGPVDVRRMFSGSGVFANGLMIALIVRDVLYLKSDDAGAARFAAEGCEQFGYTRKGGKRTALPYWRIPDRLLDDPAELADWARASLAVARKRKTAAKPAARKKRR